MYVSDIKHPRLSLEEKLRSLYALSKGQRIALSFRPPYLDLLEAFGDPHCKLPPVIHVAGTNGKGSIIATMRAIFEAAGFKVHAYTSPHLISFNERIVLAGEAIDDERLEALIDEALELNNGRDSTFFEITTAMAFAAFSRVPADICLIETGLGGRLDCTNMIEKPILTIIGSIGYDHMEYLGNTLPLIAAEKAGIMKEGISCIIGCQSPEALAGGVLQVFEDKATEKDAKLYRYGSEWFIEPDEDHIQFTFGSDCITLPPPSLLGIHQINNAGAALAALCVLRNDFPDDFPMGTEIFSAGLRAVQWRGRLQNLTSSFYSNYELSEGWELWLDGGHNEEAARALAQQAAFWDEQDHKELHLVVGMMGHKKASSFFQPLLTHLSSLTLTAISGEDAAMELSDLREALPDIVDVPVFESENFQQALDSVIHNNKRPGRILIAGSLYLVGDVLKGLYKDAHNRDR